MLVALVFPPTALLALQLPMSAITLLAAYALPPVPQVTTKVQAMTVNPVHQDVALALELELTDRADLTNARPASSHQPSTSSKTRRLVILPAQ